jgi:hypothetical protein
LSIQEDSDNYVRNHSEDYNPFMHIAVNTWGAAKDAFWPPTWYNNLKGLAENYGTTAGRYDAGKASMGEVIRAGAEFGIGLGGTAFGVYGIGKAGFNYLFGGGCSVAGTPVQVAVPDAKSAIGYRLESKPIEKVQKNEMVASRDEKTGKTSFKRVLHTTVRTVHVAVQVALSDAKTGQVVETLTTTRNHPFYVRNQGFVPAGGLAVGNAIVTRAGPDIIVQKIKWLRRPEDYQVYNFEVEDDHTYFAGKANGGVWVHNPVWCSPDPHVADIANAIEARYPGHVVGVNRGVPDAAGNMITDIDIETANAIIQVKSGTGGLGRQITSSLRPEVNPSGKPVFGYAPRLSGHMIQEILTRGGIPAGGRASDLDALLDVLKP